MKIELQTLKRHTSFYPISECLIEICQPYACCCCVACGSILTPITIMITIIITIICSHMLDGLDENSHHRSDSQSWSRISADPFTDFRWIFILNYSISKLPPTVFLFTYRIQHIMLRSASFCYYYSSLVSYFFGPKKNITPMCPKK